MELNTEFNQHGEAAPLGSAPFDASRYRQHVEHLEMPEARKIELLEAVWQIMRSFVDRAFGHDATQLSVNVVEIPALPEADDAGSMLQFQGTSSANTQTNTDSCAAKQEGRDLKERP